MLVKKIKIFLTIFVIFFSLQVSKAYALYNGSGGTAYSGKSKSNCGTTINCLYQNNNSKMLQARIYYINNGSFEQIGDTYYFVNTTAYNFLINEGFPKKYLIKIATFDNYETYTQASNYLKTNFFKDKTKTIDYFKKATGAEDYSRFFDKESEVASTTSPVTKGYRVMIEPAYNYVNSSFSNETHALITAKGLASEIKRTGKNISCLNKGDKNCNNPLLGVDSQAQQLYTTYKDVGITASSKDYCENIGVNQLADIKISCGYNLIDISQYAAPKKCYNKSIVSSGLQCINYDENNIGTFTEKYEIANCNKVDSKYIYSYTKRFIFCVAYIAKQLKWKV